MAGYSSNREQNYEIKYLRKVLTQVDNRIQIPESVDAKALRSMLDDVEVAAPRDNTLRRPRWLSVQSGIAYAAALTLIIALVYSMELYRPEIMSGTLQISEGQQQAELAIANEHATVDVGENNVQQAAAQVQPISESVVTDADANADDDIIKLAEDTRPEPAAIGGGGISTLLLEYEDKAYYCRINDMADPDTTTPLTLEVVDKDSHELLSRIDLTGINSIELSASYGDFILLVGSGDNGVAVQVYDRSAEPGEQLGLTQAGTFSDARLHKDIAYIVSVSSLLPEGIAAVELPNATGNNSCIVTAIDLVTLEVSQKAFTGMSGTAQIDDMSVSVSYEGADSDGEPKEHAGQILLDGMDITLGPIS